MPSPTLPNALLTAKYLGDGRIRGTMLSSGSDEAFYASFYSLDGDLVDQLQYAKVLKREPERLVISGISDHLRKSVGVKSIEEAEVQWTLTPSSKQH